MNKENSMNNEYINAPETGHSPEAQAAWHAGIDAGREIERNNIAAQAQPHPDELPGMWDASDLSGGMADAQDAAPVATQAPAANADARDAAFEAVRQRLCKLQRYSFLIGPNGGVRRIKDRAGNWIEFDAAHELFDPIAVDAALAATKGGSNG